MPQLQRSPLVAAALLAGLAWAGPTMVETANIGIRISHDNGEATGDVPELLRRMSEDTDFLVFKAAEKRGVISVHPSYTGFATHGCWTLAVKDWAGEKRRMFARNDLGHAVTSGTVHASTAVSHWKAATRSPQGA
jgi:hypothetical protein